MPVRPPRLRPPGWKPVDAMRKEQDRRRGTAASRGYDSRWAKASLSFRKRNPLCQYCEMEGRVTATDLVDHLYPHRTYDGVFWLKHWWVASCTECHSVMKQGVERKGLPAINALARALGRLVMGEDQGAPSL